ncbi:ankyrin repeat domain-containing protein [Noviherbaspirillum soli]|uniref:ankyrin repeat domain-containing protein n=1 Tax=Noviherbaspirillum soli TaxID=1064518 RepID=UPI00188CF71A|nr:ankyrin repeat domain-containing protein [Noviherbaspirillum soli]
MNNRIDVVGESRYARTGHPEALPEQGAEMVVPDAPLRSEQRETPLLEKSTSAQGRTRSPASTGLRFREEASASPTEESAASESESESESEEEDSLEAALRQQDPAAIEAALLACADLSQRARKSPMLLHALASLGHLHGVHLLLDANVDVNARSGQRRTPLIYAAAGGSAEVIGALLDHGANAGKRDNAGNTALHVAVLCRQYAAAAALLARMNRQQIDQPNTKGCSALFEAVSLEDAAMTRLLLQGGAQVDCLWHEASSVTPLMLAAARGNADMLHDLLTAGADPDAPDWMAATALFYAVRGGSLACVGALLDARADINARDTRYFTPLLCAVELSSTDMVHALLGRGAAMAHHARMARSIGEVRCKTEDAEFVDEDGPFMRTLVAPRLERVPQPALLLAVCKGLDGMVELLIDCGADVNFVAANGDTALAKANELGHHAIVERLLAHGARQ